jgi:hypothetical protein
MFRKEIGGISEGTFIRKRNKFNLEQIVIKKIGSTRQLNDYVQFSV